MESEKPQGLLFHRRGRRERSLTLVRGLLDSVGTAGLRDVLEIGCGDGTVAAGLAAAYPEFRILGVDAEVARIGVARERWAGEARLAFEVADARALPVAENSFDLVVTRASYDRLHAWQAALSEIARVLRPTGHLFWLDLDVPYELRALLRLWRHRYGLYTPREVAAAHADAGPQEPPVHYRRIERRTERRTPLVLVKEPQAA